MISKWYINKCLNKGYEVGEACKAYDKFKTKICFVIWLIGTTLVGLQAFKLYFP